MSFVYAHEMVYSLFALALNGAAEVRSQDIFFLIAKAVEYGTV